MSKDSEVAFPCNCSGVSTKIDGIVKKMNELESTINEVKIINCETLALLLEVVFTMERPAKTNFKNFKRKDNSKVFKAATVKLREWLMSGNALTTDNDVEIIS